MVIVILIISRRVYNNPEFVEVCKIKFKLDEAVAWKLFHIMDYDSSGYVTKQKFLILQLYYFESQQVDQGHFGDSETDEVENELT